jgi:hypothetical protein
MRPDGANSGDRNRATGAVDNQTSRRLGSALRGMYKNFESEKLPMRLQELVDRLADTEKRQPWGNLEGGPSARG